MVPVATELGLAPRATAVSPEPLKASVAEVTSAAAFPVLVTSIEALNACPRLTGERAVSEPIVRTGAGGTASEANATVAAPPAGLTSAEVEASLAVRVPSMVKTPNVPSGGETSNRSEAVPVSAATVVGFPARATTVNRLVASVPDES